MCQMFFKPAGMVVSDNLFNSVWYANSDGFGAYSFADKTVFKTLDYNAAKKYIADNAQNDLFCHFRYATGGGVSLENIHPFDTGNYIVFHNGVLSGIKPTRIKSDTAVLADMLKGAPLSAINQALTAQYSSRFYIVDKKANKGFSIDTGAKWYQCKESGILFANSYAFCWDILDNYLSDNSLTAESNYYGPDDLESLLKHNASKIELVDFISKNPDSAAVLLREYFAAFWGV